MVVTSYHALVKPVHVVAKDNGLKLVDGEIPPAMQVLMSQITKLEDFRLMGRIGKWPSILSLEQHYN